MIIMFSLFRIKAIPKRALQRVLEFFFSVPKNPPIQFNFPLIWWQFDGNFRVPSSKLHSYENGHL